MIQLFMMVPLEFLIEYFNVPPSNKLKRKLDHSGSKPTGKTTSTSKQRSLAKSSSKQPSTVASADNSKDISPAAVATSTTTTIPSTTKGVAEQDSKQPARRRRSTSQNILSQVSISSNSKGKDHEKKKASTLGAAITTTTALDKGKSIATRGASQERQRQQLPRPKSAGGGNRKQKAAEKASAVKPVTPEKRSATQVSSSGGVQSLEPNKRSKSLSPSLSSSARRKTRGTAKPVTRSSTRGALNSVTGPSTTTNKNSSSNKNSRGSRKSKRMSATPPSNSPSKLGNEDHGPAKQAASPLDEQQRVGLTETTPLRKPSRNPRGSARRDTANNTHTSKDEAVATPTKSLSSRGGHIGNTSIGKQRRRSKGSLTKSPRNESLMVPTTPTNKIASLAQTDSPAPLPFVEVGSATRGNSFYPPSGNPELAMEGIIDEVTDSEIDDDIDDDSHVFLNLADFDADDDVIDSDIGDDDSHHHKENDLDLNHPNPFSILDSSHANESDSDSNSGSGSEDSLGRSSPPPPPPIGRNILESDDSESVAHNDNSDEYLDVEETGDNEVDATKTTTGEPAAETSTTGDTGDDGSSRRNKQQQQQQQASRSSSRGRRGKKQQSRNPSQRPSREQSTSRRGYPRHSRSDRRILDQISQLERRGRDDADSDDDDDVDEDEDVSRRNNRFEEFLDAADRFGGLPFGQDLSSWGLGSGLLDIFGQRFRGNSGNGGRFYDSLTQIRKYDEPTFQLIALQDLAVELSLATEDSLSGSWSSLIQLSRELINILKGSSGDYGELTGMIEENPEVMLLACRCLSNILEAFPSVTGVLVREGLPQVLVAKLMEIHYIELAEQALSTLEALSRTHPRDVCLSNGMMASIQYIDFFATFTQRAAITCAANCAEKVPLECFGQAKEVLEVLERTLYNEDAAIAEKSGLCLVRILQSFRRDPKKLEQLVSPSLLKIIIDFIRPQSISTGTGTSSTKNSLSSRVVSQLLLLLSMLANTSPSHAGSLLDLGIIQIIQEALTGRKANVVVEPTISSLTDKDNDDNVSDSKSSTSSTATVSEQEGPQLYIQLSHEKLVELLGLLIALLPRLPRLKNSQSSTATTAESAVSDQPTSIVNDNTGMPTKKQLHSKELEFWTGRPRAEKILLNSMLPVMIHLFSSTMDTLVRKRSVIVILKIVYHLDGLSKDYQKQSHYSLSNKRLYIDISAFLNVLLSMHSKPWYVGVGLAMVRVLLDRMPDTFHYLFVREGLVESIEAISKLTDPSNVKESTHNGSDKEDEADESSEDEEEKDDLLKGLHLISEILVESQKKPPSTLPVALQGLPLLLTTTLYPSSESSDSKTSKKLYSKLATWTYKQTQNLLQEPQYLSPKGLESSGSNDTLKKLTEISERLVNMASISDVDIKQTSEAIFNDLGRCLTMNDQPSTAESLFIGGATSYELVKSGIVNALLSFFESGGPFASIEGGNIDTRLMSASNKKSIFVKILESYNVGDSIDTNNTQEKSESSHTGIPAGNALTLLLDAIQNGLSLTEKFKVESAFKTPADDSRSLVRMLGKQIRLRVEPMDALDFKGVDLTEEQTKAIKTFKRQFMPMVIEIHSIATFSLLDMFIRPRISLFAGTAFPTLISIPPNSATEERVQVTEASEASSSASQDNGGDNSDSSTGQQQQQQRRRPSQMTGRQIRLDSLRMSMLNSMMSGGGPGGPNSNPETPEITRPSSSKSSVVDERIGASSKNEDESTQQPDAVARNTRSCTKARANNTGSNEASTSSRPGTSNSNRKNSTDAQQSPLNFAKAAKKSENWHIDFVLEDSASNSSTSGNGNDNDSGNGKSIAASSSKVTITVKPNMTIYSAIHKLEKMLGKLTTQNPRRQIFTLKFRLSPGNIEAARPDMDMPEAIEKYGAVSYSDLNTLGNSGEAGSNSSEAMLKVLKHIHEAVVENDKTALLPPASNTSSEKNQPIQRTTQPLTKIKPNFINRKLSAKVNSQLNDPLIVVCSVIPEWAKYLMSHYPFLFSYPIRYNYFRSMCFGYGRNIAYWQKNPDGSILDLGSGSGMGAGTGNVNINANGTGGGTGSAGGGANSGSGDRNANSDLVLPFDKIERRKVKVSRHRLLDSALKVMELYASYQSILEIEYFDEDGVGIGPTLEFYTNVCRDLTKRVHKLWRDNDSSESTSAVTNTDENDKSASGGDSSDLVSVANGLFPRPIPSSDQDRVNSGGDTKKMKKLESDIVQLFGFMGHFVAKAILDQRILDLPLHNEFIKAIVEAQNQSLPNIVSVRDISAGTWQAMNYVDEGLTRSLLKLKEFVDKKRAVYSEIDNNIDHNDVYEKVESIRDDSGYRVEDMMLDFTLPGYPEILLRPEGEDIALTIHNVDEYISLVVDWTLNRGIKRQVEAFKTGFNKLLPTSYLNLFTIDEISEMVSGPSRDEWWTIEHLSKSIKTDHGYTIDSPPVQMLLKFMSELDQKQRRVFLKFITGAPSLPRGGFMALRPPLTVVVKACGDSAQPSHQQSGGDSVVLSPPRPDDYLPSVMTCANYIKLPNYTSIDILRKQWNQAMNEGQQSFLLS
ncbi:Ubiquitin fusion degradation protein 4 [Mycoemilia scoparia]|uniref:HECT-type E3 ubiquitin transferase n=1 Tax=Mycoemilia scoparia TaxID=417184 RepID=A0A9W8A1K2_9FUNG|nr:Ubiquitin fusion degradation protein 4 [Mycoemilia scoparia]